VSQDLQYLSTVQKYVETNFPKATLKDIHQTLIYYHIPFEETITWSYLFKIMETGKDKLSLEDYQVGDTTLEQIFLSFAKKTTSERLKITNLA